MTGPKTGAKDNVLWRWLSALGFFPPPARPKRKKKRVVLRKDAALASEDGGSLEPSEDVSHQDFSEYMAHPTVPEAAQALVSRPLPVSEPVRGAASGGLFDADALKQIDALFEGFEGDTALPLPGFDTKDAGSQGQAREEQSFFGEFGHIEPNEVEALEAAPAEQWREARIPLPVDPFAMTSDKMVFSDWPPAKLLTLGAEVNLRSFLNVFSGVSGVAGAMVIGRDGLIIDSTLDDTWDAEYIGAQACTLFMGNQEQMQKLDYGDLRRLILETDVGTLVVLACEGGLVAVVAERQSPMAVSAIMSLVSRL